VRLLYSVSQCLCVIVFYLRLSAIVTHRVMNFLIMVISVLIMHQNPMVNPLPSKPKEFQMDFNLKSLWESQEISNFGIANSCA
jgi:hypothetical protein